MGGQRQAPITLPPGKIRYPLYRRLGGPQRRCGRVRKISPLQGFDPPAMQPLASRYTSCAILEQLKYVKYEINLHFMWSLSSYLPQNCVLKLEWPVGRCCTRKQWLFILRITRNTWIYLGVWQHAVLSMIERTEIKHCQNNIFFNINNLSISPITRFDWDRHLQAI